MKRNKYNAVKTEVSYNGEIYKLDSKKEAARFNVLIGLLESGQIKDLSIHPSFELQCGYMFEKKKVRPIFYESDFRYYDNEKKQWVIEDVKGMRTEIYKIKRKLFLKILPENTVFVEL